MSLIHTTMNESTVEEIINQMDEGLAVKFSEEDLKEAGKEYETSLLIKLVGTRTYNRTAFKTVLRELWNPVHGLKFTAVEGNVLIEEFNHEADRNKVLSRGPWHFMGWAIQVEK